MELPVPTRVPPQEAVNHCHIAPVPRLPPLTVRVFVVLLQELLFAILTPVGAVEREPTVTARELAELVPQVLPAVTETVPFWPALPVVTVIEVVPAPPVIIQPDGTDQV